MRSMKCTIFNVEHGFCAFIKSPNDYGLLIDCGSRENFSPIKWIRQHYRIDKNTIKYFESKRFAKCIITHLHADHFDDIGMLEQDSPKILQRDKETMKFLDEKIREGEKKSDARTEKLKKFKKFCNKFDKDVKDQPDWGFDYFDTYQLPFTDAEGVDSDRDKIINNRSFVIGIEYAGHKILIPGDIEVGGWEEAFKSDKFGKLVKNTNFFVASHHGHKSGFTKKILDYSGKPNIYIVSARSGDDSVDSSYSNSDNSYGYKISGRAYKSHMISTREEKKSIEITINEDGSSSIVLIDASDNLSSNQAGNRARKTKKLTQGWT